MSTPSTQNPIIANKDNGVFSAWLYNSNAVGGKKRSRSSRGIRRKTRRTRKGRKTRRT